MTTDAVYVVGGIIAIESWTAVDAVCSRHVSVEVLDDKIAASSVGGGLDHFECADWARVIRRNGVLGVEFLCMRFHLVDCHSWFPLLVLVASSRTDPS